MELKIHIHNVKNIQDLVMTLTTDPGVYAITEENGAGKSTLLSSATLLLFNQAQERDNYLGVPQNEAYISYVCEGSSMLLEEKNGKWQYKSKTDNWLRKFTGNPIKGFLEGSISFGNRFKNAGFSDIPAIQHLAHYPRLDAPNFVKEGMGIILQDNTHYYDDLKVSRAVKIGDNKNDVYFYVREGQEVDQFHMSTGENLLASVLGALNNKNERQKAGKHPCLILLDEIEFGLHPAALKRLVEYFKQIATEYNYAIYFSTHSLAIINEIEDENIFYLQKKDKNANKTNIEVINPCAPAYATNLIYNLHGFDDIILVEDDKARIIINYILKKEKLIKNRLVHILHAGGWQEVLQRGSEWDSNNSFGNHPKILAILDRDCQSALPGYLRNHPECGSVPYGFLPIKSMEKFFYEKLYPHIERAFEAAINSNRFINNDIQSIVATYLPHTPPNTDDNNGKNLYKLIVRNLPMEGKLEEDLIHFTIDYISETSEYADLREFIKSNL